LGLQHGVVQIPFAPRLPVRTARLVLRQFHAKDLEPLLGFHSDADAVRYVPYPPRDRQTMRTVLERKIANTRLAHDDDLLELAVVRTEDQVLIGDVLLVLRSVEHQTVEVGYIFSPAYSRQGYATEAVRALLEVAFFELGARRVVARVDARNTASRALLERLGYASRGKLDRERVDQGRTDQRGGLRRTCPRVAESTRVVRIRSRRWPTTRAGYPQAAAYPRYLQYPASGAFAQEPGRLLRPRV
jgi:RimJ/RimL family protein N-acetyltransferase